MSTARCYAFFDTKKSQYYYHNPISNTVTWKPPKGAEVFHGDTLQVFHIISSDDEEEMNMIKTLQPQKARPKKPLVPNPSHIPSPISKDLESMPKGPTRGLPGRKVLARKRSNLSSTLSLANKTASNFLPEQPDFYFPPTIIEDQNLVDLRTFAIQNFREFQKSISFLKKVDILPDELFQADKHPNCLPLLKSTDQKKAKDVQKVFQFIRDYTRNTIALTPSQFAKIILPSKSLVDETYVLLVKQTRNNTNNDALFKTWDLFLVLCTLFVPSKQIQPMVRTILAKTAYDQNRHLAIPAQLAYIRFIGRCESGQNLREMADDWINRIPDHKNETHFTIGASIYESLWAQRRAAPFCPFPLFLHKCCEALFKYGATETEGTFRIQGNKAQIDELVNAVDSGEDIFGECDLMNLACLFKMWLRELPESIIPPAFFPQLIECHKTKNYFPILDKLPRANRETLAYLVGFLKKFVDGAEQTKMGLIPVCMIFGQNVVRINVENQDDVKNSTEIGRDLMEQLIKEWDVSFAYPIPPHYLRT